MLPNSFASWATGLFALAFCLAPASWAAVPGQVAFQGLLTDPAGDPLTQTVELGFRMFDAPSEGSELWSESHPATQVVDGLYDVKLGSVNPIGPAVLEGGPVYLEITVDGEILTPRTQLLAVPYALQAASVGIVEAEVITQIWLNAPLDGADPPNTDPREGLLDSDGDGIANFVESDNDDDGFTDATELQNGTNLNVPTPTIVSLDPSSGFDVVMTRVSVSGRNFKPTQSVSLDGQSLTPENRTPNSFDVDLGPHASGTGELVVADPTGDIATALFVFIPTRWLVFATNARRRGDFGGVAGADAVCQAEADSASLSGTYRAWLATGPGDTPDQRFAKHLEAYFRTDLEFLANDYADLADGTLAAPIDRDAAGNPISGEPQVWTNVNEFGAGGGAADCLDWTSSEFSDQGSVGVRTDTGPGWTASTTTSCVGFRGFYCVEQ